MLQRRKGTKNPKNIPPNVPCENCSHFWDIFENVRKMSKNVLTMLPYRVQYNESEYDIKNYNLFYKIAQNVKILSKSWKVNRLFTPQNRHAQTFPDTDRVQKSGAHLLWTMCICWLLLILFVLLYCYRSILGCFSDVRPFRTTNPQTSRTKWSVRKLFTLLERFLKKYRKLFLNHVPI